MTHHFYLNDQEIRTDEPAGLLLLDFVRRHATLTGTKEGCREGDCGACVVLVGERAGDGVTYHPITSCLMPLGEAHGKHIVTVEGLNGENLSPVQQAIVEEGATQCGFCTPGIVVSLTGYVMQNDGAITLDGVKEALGGHLCRCTGYRSLKATTLLLRQTVDVYLGDTAGQQLVLHGAHQGPQAGKRHRARDQNPGHVFVADDLRDLRFLGRGGKVSDQRHLLLDPVERNAHVRAFLVFEQHTRAAF